MKITIDNKIYDVEIDDNVTSSAISQKLPLELSLVRYAEHEYYSELPFTPVFAKETTSDIKAGHVYYWDGWNAFVLNFEDCNISPYKVVHIGEIKQTEVSDVLRNSEKKIDIVVE